MIWRFKRVWGDDTYDAAKIFEVLRTRLGRDDFERMCALLRTDPSEAQEVLEYLSRGEIQRPKSPMLGGGGRISNTDLLEAFAWINRFYPTTNKLVAEVLDLARVLGVTSNSLERAYRRSGRLGGMTEEDWEALLKSDLTSSSGLRRYRELLEKHVRGR